MKKKILIGSIITVVILTLVSFSSVVGYNSVKSNPSNAIITDEWDFEYCKNYLFETLVEIADNPKVKELVNNNNNRLSVEKLDFLYNMGIKLIDRLGEEKVSEIIENVEIDNPEVYEELDKVIMNDEELSERIYTLNEMNGDLISNMDFSDNPIICGILGIIILAELFFYIVFTSILDFLYGINELLVILFFFIAMPIWGPSILITSIAMFLFMQIFYCLDY